MLMLNSKKSLVCLLATIWHVCVCVARMRSNIIGDVVLWKWIIVPLFYCMNLFSLVNSVGMIIQFIYNLCGIINNYLLLQFCRWRAHVQGLVDTRLVVVGLTALTMRTYHHHHHHLSQQHRWWPCLWKASVSWAMMQVWVNYNTETTHINVTIAPHNVAKPVRALLSTTYDLNSYR
jgi:hypothetical protein